MATINLFNQILECTFSRFLRRPHQSILQACTAQPIHEVQRVVLHSQPIHEVQHVVLLKSSGLFSQQNVYPTTGKLVNNVLA